MVGATEAAFLGVWADLICRKRWIDERLIDLVRQIDGNFDADFDTRLYRPSTLAEIPSWEIDQPENINPKRARLQKLFGTIPKHVTLVPIDFDREDLSAMLAAHGYSTERPTFFIWEAVTRYLTETAIRATFDFLAAAAPGSCLAFRYIHLRPGAPL